MIICGNSLEVLKTYPDNHFDSVVTDPPYGLSFMGKKWDYDVPSKELWEEVFRVLKPGGHLLSFAGTRTQHRMAVNIEDAGFEIRDMIAWVYGSGFPKSLNISKALDKMVSSSLEVSSEKTNNADELNDQRESSQSWDNNEYGGGNAKCPTCGKWFISGSPCVCPKPKVKYQTDEANKWNGWGTALKPALEPITVARKPIKGSVAQNVLTYNVGGINIDGCRVGAEQIEQGREGRQIADSTSYHNGLKPIEKTIATGRFPANFMHDGSDEVVGLFPETKPTKPHGGDGGKLDTQNMGWGFKRMPSELSDNGGSAARFFYSCNYTLNYDTMSICKHISVNNVTKLLMTIRATPEITATSDVADSQDEKLDQNVKSAIIGCQKCRTFIAQELVRIKNLASSPEGLQAIRECIEKWQSDTLTQNLVEIVTKWVNTDTTPTTINLLTLYGSALAAIDENTSLDTKEKAEQKSEHARFLYQAKASKSERNRGLDGFETKLQGMSNGAQIHGEGYDKGQGIGLNVVKPMQNFHPTVKPVKLMQYLVRLVTPKAGLVLDPFNGSGTTGIACKLEGTEYVGIELDPDYVKISEARIAGWEIEQQEKLL